MEGYPINFEKYNDKGLYVANYRGHGIYHTDVMKLDLHGKTIHEAWRTFKEHTEICRLNGIPNLWL